MLLLMECMRLLNPWRRTNADLSWISQTQKSCTQSCKSWKCQQGCCIFEGLDEVLVNLKYYGHLEDDDAGDDGEESKDENEEDGGEKNL
jgi:hypothetical protein